MNMVRCYCLKSKTGPIMRFIYDLDFGNSEFGDLDFAYPKNSQLTVLYLNNYFKFHICLSFCHRRPCVPLSQKLTPVPAVRSQNVTNKNCLVCVMSEKCAFWVTLRPQSDCCHQGKAEVHILNQKTTRSEFQMPSQTAPAEAKPRCVYSVLKPHGQSFITSPESVQSSCVRQHTQDVPAQWVLTSQ